MRNSVNPFRGESMTSNQGVLFNWLIVIVLMWIMGYGLARIMGLHARYTAATRRLLARIWAAHRQRIIWMCVGAILTILILGPHSQ